MGVVSKIRATFGGPDINVGPAFLLAPRPRLTIGPSEKNIEGPQPPMVLRSVWIDFKKRVVNLSYIFTAPKSQHIIADLTSLPLILSQKASKHILEDLNAKPGPT